MDTFFDRLKSDKKTQALIALSVVALLFVATLIGIFIFQDSSEDLSEQAEVFESEGNFRKLDGVQVAEDASIDGYPVAVIIENLTKVRPQASLSKASVVYEALAEGGITRFMGVYSSTDAEKIGPVRSARTYFVDLASEYNPLFVHAGGSSEALAQIPQAELTDLNQIDGDQDYFFRDDVLRAPHNLFTKSEFMTFALRDKKLLNESSTYDAWKFQDDIATSAREESVEEIEVDFSSPDYTVSFEYDADTNTYLRNNGGTAHVDELTGKQLAPKNVVVQYVKQEVVDSEGRLSIDVVGNGEGVLYQNGQEIQIKWSKSVPESRTQFTTKDNGDMVSFVRGQTWIMLVPKENK